MDELSQVLHQAIDAALAGDRQALLIARWLLDDLRARQAPARH